jgi:hypothetical protein
MHGPAGRLQPHHERLEAPLAAQFFNIYLASKVINMTSYMIFSGPNNSRYAIKSDDCLTCATDPANTKYLAYPVDSKDHITKNEAINVLRSDLDPAGCVLTDPAS